MNKEQLFKITAAIEVGKGLARETKPVNIEPLFACGRHKAAAKAVSIVYERFPEAKRVICSATALTN